MEVPGLGFESLQAYGTATSVVDPRHICNLCRSLQQHQILNPLSEARDQTLIVMETVGSLTQKPQWELLYFILFYFILFYFILCVFVYVCSFVTPEKHKWVFHHV